MGGNSIGFIRQEVQVLFFAWLTMAFALATGPVPAWADDIDKLTSETQKQIKSAENQMFSGKNEAAAALLDDAAAKIATINASAPQHRTLNSLESSYERTRKALDKKLERQSGAKQQEPPAAAPPPTGATASGADDGPAAPAAQAEKQPAAAAPYAAPQGEKLPGGVSKRLKDIGAILDNTEAHLAGGGKAEWARYQLEKASGLFAEIDQQYGGKFSPANPEFTDTQTRYAKVERQVKDAKEQELAGKAQAADAEAAKEVLSTEWVQKFTPYVANPAQEGHDSNRYLVYPGTSDPQALEKMRKAQAELAALLAQYEQVSFPNGKTWQLEQAEGEAKRVLDNFASSLAGGVQGAADQAESNLAQALAQLNKGEWKSDSKATPPIVDRNWAERINEMVAQAEQMLPAADEKLATIKAKQQQMQQLDAANRKAWAERTFLRPEIYQGKDLEEVRSAAGQIVAKEIPGGKILRISVYKDAWKEESVLEHTDTTQTAVRYRVTQMINAQVAAKEGDVVRLHTLHIAKDKQSEGWGKLYGNIMSSDIMLEGNVSKDGP